MAACGGISALTLEAARRSPDFDVVAIQDVDAEALHRVGDRYGIDRARRHARFESLLTDDIDFVVINSPNHCHLDQVRATIAAGKHCLVQKPMGRTTREAEAMVAAAAQRGVKLGVVMFELSKPIHHQVRAMIASGWLGEPVLVQAVHAHANHRRRPPAPGDWRRDREQVGGGAFIQLAGHHLNLAAWMLGRDIIEISLVGAPANAARGAGGDGFAEETVLASAVFEGGPVAGFAASFATDACSFSIAGTRGVIQLSPEHVTVRGETSFDGDVFDYAVPGEERVVRLRTLEDAIREREAGVEVHGAFARWIGGGDAFSCPGESGLRDVKVIEAAHRSLAEGRSVRIR